MRFSSTDILKILTDAKTQFRVPVGMPATIFNPRAITHSVRPVGIDLSTGRPVEVEPLGYVRVLELRRELLAYIAPPDVACEGYGRAEQFWRAFLKRWRIREYDAPHVEVYVVTFERERVVRAKYMARQDGQISPPQYVDNPVRAIDNAEVVPVGDISVKWREKAIEDQAKAKSDGLRARAKQRLDDRLRAVSFEARNAGVDVSSDLRVIERRVAAIERKVSGLSAA